ncbi:MAG: 2-hydroxyacyl-CoA dehydratase subunit D [Planctomycetota bacterium]|jgi:benzoyl-CoA reductase/2-hydroxyglutaryl-CoA dehydratase subunit BcrC/BadD/HgdB
MEKQFRDSYRVEPARTDHPAGRKKQAFIEQEQVRKQSELAQRPSNIAFFEKVMYGKPPEKGGRPRVGTFCNMVPAEIVSAMGADPVRLDCGNSAAALAGEEILSGEICPVAKGAFGMFVHQDPLASSCDLLIVPTSCDAKKKMGEILNDFKPSFMLNVPPEQSHERYIRSTLGELKRMVDFLRGHLKTKLSASGLRKAIERTKTRTALVRRLQELRIGNPRILSIRDLFLVIQSSTFRVADLDAWNRETRKVVEELEKAEPPRKSLRPRLVLSGAPIVWPNYKALNLLEECGADVVADTICTGAQSCVDPVVVDERNTKALLRALAGRYVYATICPCFISQETRMNRILELHEDGKAQGVVNYSLRLCQLFDVENYRIGRVLKERGIPFLNLRTDYSLEDTEQLRVRIEAFLETL